MSFNVLRRPLAIAVVAIGIGPLLPALLICGFTMAVAAFDPTTTWSTALQFFGGVVFGAYAAGSPVAALSAALLIAWSYLRPVRIWPVLAAALLASLFWDAMTRQYDISDFKFDAAMATFSAFFCWLLFFRMWRKHFAQAAAPRDRNT